MNGLSREFSTREKVLIIILVIIVVALAYYRLFYVPSTESIELANAQREAYQSDLTIARAKERQLKNMQEEMDRLGELQSTSRIESYNNSKAEMELLNQILESASDYSIKFDSVTRDGDTVRRNFSLSFTTGSFRAAKKIVKQLSESELRCLLGDVSYKTSYVRLTKDQKAPTVRRINDGVYGVFVQVDAMATFFETMYDGVADAGLPAA